MTLLKIVPSKFLAVFELPFMFIPPSLLDQLGFQTEGKEGGWQPFAELPACCQVQSCSANEIG